MPASNRSANRDGSLTRTHGYCLPLLALSFGSGLFRIAEPVSSRSRCLRHALSRHVQMFAQLVECAAVARMQQIQELPSADHSVEWAIGATIEPGIAGSTVFVNYALWESVAHFRNAFKHPEFKSALERYPSSAVASPHLFERLSVPNLCIGP